MNIDLRKAIVQEIDHLAALRCDMIDSVMDFLERDLWDLQHWRNNVTITHKDFERFNGALDMARFLGAISDDAYRKFKQGCEDAYDEYYEASAPEGINEG